MTDRWTHASPDPIAVNLESSLTPSMPSNIVSHSHSLSSSYSLPRTIAEDDDSDSNSDSDGGSGSDDNDEDKDSDGESDSEDSESDDDSEDEGSDSDSDSNSDSSEDSSDDDSDSEDAFSSDLNSRETVSALPQEQLSGITIATVSNSTSSSTSMSSGNSSVDSQLSQSASLKMTTPSSSTPKSTQGPPSSSSSPSHASPTPDSAAKSVSTTKFTSSPPPSPAPSTPSHSETSSSDPHSTSSPNVMESLKQSPGTSGHPSSSSSPSHSTSVNVNTTTTSVHNSTSLMVSTTSSHSITSSTNSISSTPIPSHSMLNEPQVIVSTGPEATTVPSSHASHGFFSDHSLVAGVFVAVTVAVLILLGLLPWIIARCRRRRKRNQYQPAKLMISRPNPFPYDDETHHKRASQMRTFGDILSAGASRPVSNASDGSHTPTHDSHHSTAPMIQRNSKTLHPAVLLPSYPKVHSNFTPYNDSKLPIFDLPNLPRDIGVFQVEPINLVRENTFYPQALNEQVRHRYGLPVHDNLRGEEKNDGEEHHVTPKSLRTVPLFNLPRPHEDTRIETPRNSMLLTPPRSGRPIIPPRNPRRLTISSVTPPKIFPHPLSNQSQHSVAQSSPSIYPPTLPGEGDHGTEDEYWQKQGFESVAFLSDKPVHRPFRQPPPESSLGLQLGNSSETTIGPGHKNGPVHSNVQFSNGHKRTSSMPPDVLISEGRYPSLTYKATRF